MSTSGAALWTRLIKSYTLVLTSARLVLLVLGHCCAITRSPKERRKGTQERRAQEEVRTQKEQAKGQHYQAGDQPRDTSLPRVQQFSSQTKSSCSAWMEELKSSTLVEQVLQEAQSAISSTEDTQEAKKMWITEVETTLPPLHGEGANFEEYMKHRHAYEQPLSDFYSGNAFHFKKQSGTRRELRMRSTIGSRTVCCGWLWVNWCEEGGRQQGDHRDHRDRVGQVFVKYQAFLFAWDLSRIFCAKGTVYSYVFCSIVAFIPTLHCLLVCGHAHRAILSSG